MQKRLKELKGELDSQRSISNDNPSYVLKRAISSVKYYTGQFAEADTILQNRIEKSRQETEKYQDTLRKKIEEAENDLQNRIEELKQGTEKYKKEVQTKLEEAEHNLETEKAATPARIVAAENRYKRVLEDYMKLGFETEKEKLARESSESQYSKVRAVASHLPNTHNPLLENHVPVVCGEQVVASPSNFVNPDSQPISRTIELSETISKPLPPGFDTIGEDDVLLSLRKLHNPNSKAFKPNSTPTNLLESRPLSRRVITPQIPLTQDSDDEPTQEEIDEAARKVRESYKKPNPQTPLTQMVRLSSSGKPMKSVKIALAR